MAKSQTQQSGSTARTGVTRATDQGNFLWGDLQGSLPGAKGQAAAESGTAADFYTSGTGGVGAYDPATYNKIANQTSMNIATGGYDPSMLDTLQSDVSGEVSTGGFDPTQAGKVRAGYENLAATGGISPETAGAIERKAASAAQGTYATLGQNLARKQAASGFGGGGGETAEMARQAAEAAATATTGAEAQIGQLRQQGTIAGLGGLSQFEQGTAAGRRAGVAQEAGVASDVSKGRLASSQAQQDLATNAAQQRITSAGGLVNLYNSSPGYVNSLVQQLLQTQQQTGTLTIEGSQILAELSKNPSLFQTILGDITSLGGAAGGVMTGIGNLP